MIKAKKGLIITLFAAMMIFAFGATSAFATAPVNVSDDVTWNSDYSVATYDKKDSAASWEFRSDGLTVATATWKYDSTVYYANCYFYDFAGAKLAENGTMSAAYYWALNTQPATVLMKKPTSTTVTVTGPNNAVVGADGASWVGYNVKYVTDTTVTSGSAKVEAKVTVNGASEPDGLTVPFTKGDIEANTVTIVSEEPTPASSGWYYVKDGDTTTTPITEEGIAYDGNEHVAKYYPGKEIGTKYSEVTYKKWDAAARAWTAVESATFKEADSINYKAVWTETTKNASGASVTTQRENAIELNVKCSGYAPSYEWTDANAKSQGGHKYYELTEAQAADPTQFVEVKNGFTKANKGNVDADITELKAYFNERFTIDVEKNAIDSNQQVWTIVDKYSDWTQAEKNAFAKKYEQLGLNYVSDGDVAKVLQLRERDNSVKVVIVDAPTPVLQDDVVDITYAPTKVTYKAKKIKKASKSFTVEASAKSKKAITYSLKTSSKKITIDSATGKVTVAKGLKKGTYKITVIARTDDGNGYKAAQDTAAITIKVKK